MPGHSRQGKTFPVDLSPPAAFGVTMPSICVLRGRFTFLVDLNGRVREHMEAKRVVDGLCQSIPETTLT